jgi:hypothetical protein
MLNRTLGLIGRVIDDIPAPVWLGVYLVCLGYFLCRLVTADGVLGVALYVGLTAFLVRSLAMYLRGRSH